MYNCCSSFCSEAVHQKKTTTTFYVVVVVTLIRHCLCLVGVVFCRWSSSPLLLAKWSSWVFVVVDVVIAFVVAAVIVFGVQSSVLCCSVSSCRLRSRVGVRVFVLVLGMVL